MTRRINEGKTPLFYMMASVATDYYLDFSLNKSVDILFVINVVSVSYVLVGILMVYHWQVLTIGLEMLSLIYPKM